MQDNLKYWVWLSILSIKVKLETIHKLLEEFKFPKEIFKLNEEDLKLRKIHKFQRDEILRVEYKQNLENYLYYMEKEHIKIITCKDKKYPKRLLEIENYPIVLYVKGNEKILNDYAISIVGCRLCSSYGKNIAESFSYNLAKNNIVIVSGLARGIDTWAHIGCLKANGKTIAVLGSGIDILYPPENRGIYEKIIKTGGAIVSEFIVGTKPDSINFPRRNRIIAGISNSVLLVEAKKRSGSLITINFALNQGKDVFVIPGDITRENSVAPNELIKEGAIPVTCMEDIIHII